MLWPVVVVVDGHDASEEGVEAGGPNAPRGNSYRQHHHLQLLK